LNPAGSIRAVFYNSEELRRSIAMPGVRHSAKTLETQGGSVAFTSDGVIHGKNASRISGRIQMYLIPAKPI
jgi:hypothetical protein